MHPDEGYIRLNEIYTEFSQFCQKKGSVCESDTRIKVIDRIL